MIIEFPSRPLYTHLAAFVSSGWPKLWPVGGGKIFFFLFFLFFSFGKKIVKIIFLKHEKMKKKSS